jgi:hypothetical protein
MIRKLVIQSINAMRQKITISNGLEYTYQKLEVVLEQLNVKQEVVHAYFLQGVEVAVDWLQQVVPVPMVKLYLDGE